MVPATLILTPIPGPDASGPDLKYDPVYDHIKALREQSVYTHRDDPREEKDPRWGEIIKVCADVLTHRSKDLQIAVWLTEALARRDGIRGLTEGLDVIRGLIEVFWETLHPMMEDGDPEWRVGLLEWLDSRFASPISCDSEEDLRACANALRALESVLKDRIPTNEVMFPGFLQLFALTRLMLKAPEPRRRSFSPQAKLSLPDRRSRRLDRVDFTLTAPGVVAPGLTFEVLVWVHIPAERGQVIERAHDEMRRTDLLVHTKGPVRLERGAALTVKLKIAGALIEEPEDSVMWDGETTYAAFVVRMPDTTERVSWPGTAYIYAATLQIAKIPFVLPFQTAVPDALTEAGAVRYRQAFASYAAPDRDEVLARVQGMLKAAPGLQVFLDVLSLRSGQDWERVLTTAIPASDIFYLFWSSNARASEWVEKEWRCALRERGLDFIDPVPLEPPDQAPPPQELATLHFNDWMLAFLRRRTVGTRQRV